MDLKEYNRKRDFKKTAEPRGKLGKANKSGSKFVIQKHDATHLHYDFRLELDGVLKSWAVPKGPSLNPKDKRLAAQVEDHPIDYGDFEGIIPAGEYGGGTVMLWDRGTWEPIGDAKAGIANGKIHFVLHGEKLRGEWALVRMHGKFGDGGRNWLLFKVADKYASDKTLITETKTKSVKTKRSLDQIGDERDAVWAKSSKKAAGLKDAESAAMPTKFAPELATLVDHPPQGKEWIHEIKYDGYRILAFVKNGKVQLISRNGNEFTDRFPSVVKALSKLKADTAILDGELCAVNDQGHSDFQSLQAFLKDGEKASLVYYVFDLPFFDAVDLTQTPLIERKNTLEKILEQSKLTSSVQFSAHIAGDGDEVISKACHMHLEGIISKRSNSPYVSRRTTDWVKSKCTQRQEFIILGYTEPQGARSGFGALLVGYHGDDGKLQYAGRVGTGFNDKLLRSMLKQMKALSIDQPSVDGEVPAREKRAAHWIKPTLVAEVNFAGWTRENSLRHPVYVGMRIDKKASQVVREKPVATQSVEKKTKSKSSAGSLASRSSTAKTKRLASEPANEESPVVYLSHPDKDLYPGEHITKQMLADYYSAAQEWMLPHVADRPLALVRCPGGQGTKCFFARNWKDGLPEPIGQVNVAEGKGRDAHLTIHDAAGLTALVQIGTLEVHTWGCRNVDIEHPDQLIFDLDPGPDVTWKQVVDGARVLQKSLAKLKLDPLVKTTGGKGLHLVLPIVPDIDWESAKAFCGEIANQLAKEDDRFVANMRKDLRGGKIYVDYHRNGRSATAVAAYSTRARPGAAVSMPVSWDEIGKLKSAAHFTVETAPRYLQKRKADPWRDFEKHRVDLRKLVGA